MLRGLAESALKTVPAESVNTARTR